MKKALLALALLVAFGSAIYAAGASSPITGFSWDNVRKVVRLMTSDGQEIQVAEAPKQYSSSVVDTTTGNCVATSALKLCATSISSGLILAIPYRTSDGVWRIRFNGFAGYGAGVVSIDVYIGGITSGAGYAIACAGSSSTSNRALLYSDRIVRCEGASQTGWYFSGDIGLIAKPAWAD